MSLRPSCLTVLFLCCALLGACAGNETTSLASPNSAGLFLPDENMAKVFFYADYDATTEKPYFEDVFRWHIDGGYNGDIKLAQFIETKLPPGAYNFSADEMGWSGFAQSSAKLKMTLQTGGMYFIEYRILPEGKSVLTIMDMSDGKKAVLSRARLCPC